MHTEVRLVRASQRRVVSVRAIANNTKSFSLPLAGLLAMLLLLSACSSVLQPQPNQTQRGMVQYLQDQSNVKKVLDTLYKTDARFQYARIEPHVFMGVLLLTGQVPDAYMSQLAVDAVQQQSQVTGVSLIHNYLTTQPKPSYAEIAQDDYIANTLKQGAYALPGVSDKSVYIATDKAVVYMMGRVSEINANALVQLAQQIPGVLKVVMLVDIVKLQPAVIPVASATPAPTMQASSAQYASTMPTISTQTSVQQRAEQAALPPAVTQLPQVVQSMMRQDFAPVAAPSVAPVTTDAQAGSVVRPAITSTYDVPQLNIPYAGVESATPSGQLRLEATP